jgi:NAD(P)-dependent dehydrogenase (short-subunit alcohol dehydrogenase family)
VEATSLIEGWRGWQPGGALLEGEVALIAGGGMGIGEASALILAAGGAAVGVMDNDAERADAVVKRITDRGGRAVPVVGDLTNEDDCREAVSRTVQELGGVDILVNVAGGMRGSVKWQPMREWTTDTWDEIVHLNLRYVFWMSRAAIPVMEARGGGSIVSVTSISGVFGAPNHAAYGAAKAGLIQLTKTLALECGRLGIRVNAVSPGAVRTPARTVIRSAEEVAAIDAMVSRVTPLGRIATPEDVGRAILYFASPISDYVTGQMLLVDGGVSAKFPFMVTGADSSQVGV